MESFNFHAIICSWNGVLIIGPVRRGRVASSAREVGSPLYGEGGKSKKFSGWQEVILKRLFADRNGVIGHDAGANRLVDFMARLRLSRLSAMKMGAARRVSLRLHR